MYIEKCATHLTKFFSSERVFSYVPAVSHVLYVNTYKLKLIQATDDKTASKMLSSFQIQADLLESLFEDYVPVLQLNVEALSEHPYPMKDG